ncbi:hypothetical protein DDQ68_14450 [Hymenobacter nivis]|uniref:Uncharacterized protein n=2 Tax=Hymenobacter nivis TaxID=1850093 RepID=A0A2Z3GS63_9BACT|nr:hypothetical protein DDQ68_14450 [Hymenobacter nivis]
MMGGDKPRTLLRDEYKYLRQASAFLVCSGLLLGLGGCSTPVAQYPAAQLFPPNYAAALADNMPLALSESKLCRGFAGQWDSILVVKPYVAKSEVKSLPISNYSAISDQVDGQSLDESNCTLLFVKAGRYVAYSVVLRTIDLATVEKQKNAPFVWLAKPDAQHLFMKKKAAASVADTAARYSVVLAAQK